MKTPLYPLFKHMLDEHDWILLHTQLYEIIDIVRLILPDLTDEDNKEGILLFKKTMKNPLYPLFKHLHDEHDLILLDTQLQDIIDIARSIIADEAKKEAITLFRKQNQ